MAVGGYAAPLHLYMVKASSSPGSQEVKKLSNRAVDFTAMEQEKRETVSPIVFDYGEMSRSTDYGEMSRSTDYSDFQHGRTPSIIDIDEPEQVEERLERRGDSVWSVVDYLLTRIFNSRISGEF